MTLYEFGVMSNKWSLEADDSLLAKTAMSIFVGSNVPVAVYKPKKGAFMPVDILKQAINRKPVHTAEQVNDVLASIKESSLSSRNSEVKNG